jgi:hypothetical protein
MSGRARAVLDAHPWVGIMIRKLLAAGAAALVAVTAAGAAQAHLVRATITNGVFDDGGTFAGWFLFDDAAILNPPAWHLVTTAGATLPGDTYKPGPHQFAADSTLLTVFRDFTFEHGSPGDFNGLELLLDDPPPGNSNEGHVFCAGFCLVERFGTFDYQLTPVPEPGAWSLTILGFGLAGAALRRRRIAGAA